MVFVYNLTGKFNRHFILENLQCFSFSETLCMWILNDLLAEHVFMKPCLIIIFLRQKSVKFYHFAPNFKFYSLFFRLYFVQWISWSKNWSSTLVKYKRHITNTFFFKKGSSVKIYDWLIDWLVFNANFSNISAISWCVKIYDISIKHFEITEDNKFNSLIRYSLHQKLWFPTKNILIWCLH